MVDGSSSSSAPPTAPPTRKPTETCTPATGSATHTTPILPSPPLGSPTKDHSFFESFSHRVQSKSRSPTRPTSAKPPARIDTTTNDNTRPGASPVQSQSPSTSPQHSHSPTSRRPSSRQKRHSSSGSGTFTQCGRHGNEWLFNNFSVTDTVKGLLERKDS